MKINLNQHRFAVYLSHLSKQSIFYYLLLLIVCLSYWFIQTTKLEFFIAAHGSSPLHWLYLSMDNVKSALDWPTGTRNLGKSLTINLYSLFYYGFGIGPQKLMVFYMALEIFFMVVSFIYFYKVTHRDEHLAIGVIYTLIVSLTALQHMNLANFAYPFHWGLYYSFAAGMRILAFAYLLQDKPWRAASCFGLSLMIHPIIGGIGVVVGTVVILFRGISGIKRYLLPGLVMGGASALWLLWSFTGDRVTGGSIPIDDWFALTTLFNYHWYPISLGVFTNLSHRFLLPMMSLGLLYLIFEFFFHEKPAHNREIKIIIGVLFGLTLLGLIVSVVKSEPFLVKLSLHRASDLLVAIIFALVATRLWHMCSHGPFLIRFLSLLILASPIFSYKVPGFPLFLSLLLTGYILWMNRDDKNLYKKRLSYCLWGCGALVFFLYVEASSLHSIKKITSFYSHLLFDGKFIVALLITMIVGYLGLDKKIGHILIPVFISCFVFTNHLDRTKRYNSNNYGTTISMQKWARDNTPETSLFMIDPGGRASWRDLSRRASFGNINEWLHKAWLYDSDPKLFAEGNRRFSLLGLNAKDFYIRDSRRIAKKKIQAAASHKYYSAKSDWFIDLAKKEGIHYFIFERKRLKQELIALQPVFENDRFVIMKLK